MRSKEALVAPGYIYDALNAYQEELKFIDFEEAWRKFGEKGTFIFVRTCKFYIYKYIYFFISKPICYIIYIYPDSLIFFHKNKRPI